MRLRNMIGRPGPTLGHASHQAHLRCEALESRDAPSANYLGVNLSGVDDWSTDRIFADAMMSARRPSNVGSHLGTPAIDANGWPATDCSIVAWHGIGNMNGTYRLSFTGQADVSTYWGATTIQNRTYNPTTNTSTADIIYWPTDGSGLLLNFINSRRTPNSPINTGVTNIKLMRPTAPGSTTSYGPSTTFTKPLKDLVSHFSVVRMMDNTGTNGSDVNGVWTNRRAPSYASQAAMGPANGMAWEYAIQFWNETNTDAWINIPFTADDNYVTQLATLLKNNLAPGRKLYVEYSNELWNMWGPFPGVANRNASLAEVQTNPSSPLNYDNIYPTIDPNGWQLPARRIAYQTARLSNIFRQVFGDGDMMSRVRPVLMTQLGFADGWLSKELDYFEDYFDNPTYQATPHPASYFLYGAGGSAYQDPDWSIGSNITVDQIFATMPHNFSPDVQEDMNWVAAFGLKRIAYEGGPALDNLLNNASVPTATLEAAWNDPRMRTELANNQSSWSAAGGDLLMYFASTGGPQWGLTHDTFSQNTPKMQAIADLNASPAAPETYGKLAPLDLVSADFNIPYWQGNIGAMRVDSLTQEWNGAVFRVDSAGDFSIKAAANSSSGGRVEILVDGKSIGIVDVPPSGDTATLPLGTLQPGLHGIVLRVRSGSFGLSKVSVVASSNPTPPPPPPTTPAAPTNLTASAASANAINLTWSDQSNNETGFVLDRATDSTFSNGLQSFNLAANTTIYNDSGLSPITTCYYRVRAVNTAGSSAYSNSVSATTNPSATNGLFGVYFDNKDLTGPTVSRTDPTVDFYWTGSPASGIGGDTFSVRWTGQIQAVETGTYRFRTLSDDGVRLWINGTRIINNWTNHSATYNASTSIALTAGQRYNVKMEFYENTGAGTARLEWRRPGQTSYVVVPQSRLFPDSPGPILFADNFDNGLGNWGVVSGNWGMAWTYGGRNTVDGSSNSAEELSIAASAAWADYSMAAWVNLSDLNGSASILGRVTDGRHYYQLEVRKNSAGQPSWFINKRDGDVVTQLASGTLGYTAGSWLRLRLTMKGTTLTAESSTDGTTFSTLGSATDGRYAVGKVGLRASNSSTYFDDVVVQGV